MCHSYSRNHRTADADKHQSHSYSYTLHPATYLTLIQSCTFSCFPTGTATGRLSCESPNLQTLPTKGKLASRARAAIVASPGYRLVSADYSQVRCRLRHLVSFNRKPDAMPTTWRFSVCRSGRNSPRTLPTVYHLSSQMLNIPAQMNPTRGGGFWYV